MKLKGLCVYCGMEGVSNCSSCSAYVCSRHLSKKDICFKCIKGTLI